MTFQKPIISVEKSPAIEVAIASAEQRGTDEATKPDVHPLPSSKFRYSKWNELNSMEVTSNMLRSPRIRQGPKGFNDVAQIALLEQPDHSGNDIKQIKQRQSQERKKSTKRQTYKNKLENWEHCESVNLSYQDLGHPYQTKEFMRVLLRLCRCESIQLIDNSLKDLHRVSFPRCKELYLQGNHIDSFKKLPRLFMCEHLSLQQNNISSLVDIHCLQHSRIKSLVLQDNPVALESTYRAKVFAALPNLVLLDHMPKQRTDSLPSDGSVNSCAVS